MASSRRIRTRLRNKRVPGKELIQDLGRFVKRGHGDGVDAAEVAEHVYRNREGGRKSFYAAPGARSKVRGEFR